MQEHSVSHGNPGQSVPFDDAARAEAGTLIDLGLAEDLGSTLPEQQRDITTASVVPEHVHGSATFVARQPGILCGIAVVKMVVDRVDRADRGLRRLKLDVFRHDGEPVQAGQAIAVLAGNAQDILVAERTCLNFLGRLSGISSLTRQFVEQVQGTSAQVLDTRKTTPGWRHLEKYAVRCGGGHNHRMGLFDAVLIKDNHLAMLDFLNRKPLDEIREAITRARNWIDQHASRLPHGRETIVQIEVDRLDQLEQAMQYDVDIVLLDNMNEQQLKQAVRMRDRQGREILLEASGGVSLQTIGNIARTGVDRISVGALTHSAVNLDIGLDWRLGPDPAAHVEF
jgi:nicotinate-nucleotide pyrophosphorylase (carboxylating)